LTQFASPVSQGLAARRCNPDYQNDRERLIQRKAARRGDNETMTMDLNVNGRLVRVEVDTSTPLLDVLRNHLDLKGSRYGCGLEQCGTCMVLIDGVAAYSCMREVGSVAGRAVTTIEGLGTPDQPHPLQRAFLEEQAGQCGYCLSGIIISAKALLDRTPCPSRADIVAALDKHLCRCGTHTRIIAAVQRAAGAMA
jgi:nicotinate dehydrogenase subunit A